MRGAAALLLAAVGALSAAAAAVRTQPREPAVRWARSAILVDQATGRVLFERNADEPLEPASLTKLMTLHLVFQKLADRSIRRDDVVWYSSRAYAASQPPASSLMNLAPGLVVTVAELMKGAAIQSGNDAAVALAELAAGSQEAFVRWMNEESRFLGDRVTRWTDPAGADPGNVVTAREFAHFCRRYIEQHPEALGELHSLREFRFPLPHNLPDRGPAPEAGEVTFNHNWLVQGFGVDGLKTGRWDETNSSLAVTARRDGRRLVAVLLGVPGATVAEASLRRSQDAIALLAWGFRSYTAVPAPPAPPDAIRVWKGTVDEVAVEAPALEAPEPPALAVRPDELAGLVARVEAPDAVVAPVRRGQRIGELVYASGQQVVARFDLLAAADVERAGPLKRLWDAVRMTVRALLAAIRGTETTGSTG